MLTVFLEPVWKRPTPLSPDVLDDDDNSWWPVTNTTDSKSRLLPTELLPGRKRKCFKIFVSSLEICYNAYTTLLTHASQHEEIVTTTSTSSNKGKECQEPQIHWRYIAQKPLVAIGKWNAANIIQKAVNHSCVQICFFLEWHFWERHLC